MAGVFRYSVREYQDLKISKIESYKLNSLRKQIYILYLHTPILRRRGDLRVEPCVD